jgi:glycosyl transferase family 2
MHVLLSDTEAEHIPGCNMSFRKEALAAVGGFDPRYRTAGDDVDLCWRLMDRGGTIGFHPGAMVWHHRRNSVRTYWRQQLGYGRAEALLEHKWPERYNALGHYAWAGRIYGTGLTQALARARGRVYQGSWGSAPFQSLYQPQAGWIASLPLMPEWFLACAALASLSLLGLLWRPLLLALPLFVLAVLAPVAQALVSARHAAFPGTTTGGTRLYWLSALLHLLQPLARLRGRIRHGLTPWRARGELRPALPIPRRFAVWTERWRAGDARLAAIEAGLRAAGVFVRRGGDFDRWDLEVRGGLLGSARLLMGVEEHGQGRQMVRGDAWPRLSLPALAISAVFIALGLAAWLDHAPLAAGILAALALALAGRVAWEAGRGMGALAAAVERDLAEDR